MCESFGDLKEVGTKVIYIIELGEMSKWNPSYHY